MITTPTNILNACKDDAEAIKNFQEYSLRYTREIIDRMRKRLVTLKGARHRDMLSSINSLEAYCDQVEREGIISVMNDYQMRVHDALVAREIALDQIAEWFIS